MQAKSQQSNNTNPLNFFIERGGDVIENEHGWLNFYVDGEVAYLENMYIYPESRRKNLGTSLLMQLEMHLKEIECCKLLYTTINRVIGKENVDKTLMICLRRGFKFFSADSSVILLQKEI